MEQLESQLDFDLEEMIQISAKTGFGVKEVFQAVIERIPPPPVPKDNNAVKLFLFDARFVPSRGVACLVKVMQGQISIEKIKQLMAFHNQSRYQIYEYGIVQPHLVSTEELKTGQVGYFVSNMKEVADAKIGDTFYVEGNQV